ncbi:signal peptidase I [Candidatus Woesearchaeota archaeon]|nr:signal peptidase I [Candidatus Woesearchaeota archaeon]
MKLKNLILIIAVFAFGIMAGNAFSGAFSSPVYDDGYEFPSQIYSGLTGRAIERPGPTDTVPERDIEVYNDKVIISIKDAIYAKFTDTNSMDPVIDAGANAIEVKPKTADDVQEGDIIAYKNSCAGDGTIIHRVIKQGADDLGIYWLTKGDNNPKVDPCKVRLDEITGKVVAIIY